MGKNKVIHLILDQIPTAIRFVAVFEAFDDLKEDHALHLKATFDLTSLMDIFVKIRDNQGHWEWTESGPEIWRAQLRKK